MEYLSTITYCQFEDPTIERSKPDNSGHLLRIGVNIESGVGPKVARKKMLFYIQALKNGNGWELHNPTLEKIKREIKEEGFNPDSFDIGQLESRLLGYLG